MKIPPFLAAGLLMVATSVSAQEPKSLSYVFDIADQHKPSSPYFDVDNDPVVAGPGGSPAGAGAFMATEGKSQLYIHLNEIFERDEDNRLKIGDLASITYWTQSEVANSSSWYFLFYTEGSAGWYGMKFQGKLPKAPDSLWTEWSSDTPELFSGFSYKDISAFTDYSFDQIVAEYGDEYLHLFSFHITGVSSAHQIDNITFTLTNGDQAHIKLIPEPAVFSFFAAGGIAYALFRRKRLV